YLDAPQEVLVRRYEGTRRRHPLGGAGVEEAIVDERRLLEPLRDRADVVLDTGQLNVNELRTRVLALFGDETDGMRVSLVSFGYKHGLPLDADLVFDCRFLPNPHWVDELRPHSGLDEPVREFVLSRKETARFLDQVEELLGTLLPAFVAEGKSYLTVAMGCTGGRHRSVVLAEELARRLAARGASPTVSHRDVAR
ncbi:MAG: RNase adapter RapZ, partial [Acidobacteriota bacterium]|nr:RNase adapter RapZ [Acidobacteriota bacterium]